MIVILDALDRVSDMEVLRAPLMQTCACFSGLESEWSSLHRLLPSMGSTDHCWIDSIIIHLPPVDPSNADAREFLASVLAARDPEG